MSTGADKIAPHPPQVIQEHSSYHEHDIDAVGKFSPMQHNGDPEGRAYTKRGSHHYVEAIDNGTHYIEHADATTVSVETRYDNFGRRLQFDQTVSQELPDGTKVKTQVFDTTNEGLMVPEKVWPPEPDNSRITRATKQITHKDGTVETKVYTGERAVRKAKAARRLSGIYKKRREAAASGQDEAA